MRRFLEPQQSFRKGQLSSPANGKTLVDRVGLRDFISTRWFLMLQPSVGFKGRPFENHFPNQMGNLRL
jgi:hypothetical protein